MAGTYTAEDYRLTMSPMILEEVWETSIWYPLTSQVGVADWVNGANKVNWPRPAWSYDKTDKTGINVEDRARGGDWATAVGGDQSIVTLTRSGGLTVSNEIDYEDALELPWNSVEETRQAQSISTRIAFDGKLYAAVLAGTPAANVSSIGTASSIFINPSGVVKGAVGELIHNEIERFSTQIKVANITEPGSDSFGTAYCVMHPYLFSAFRLYMLSEKLSWDQLTADILQRGSVLGGGAWMGRIYGVDIVGWNGAVSRDIGSSNVRWPMQMGVTRAVRSAMRPTVSQFFEPAQNQVSSNPAFLMRNAFDFAHVIVHGTTLYRRELATK